MRKQTNAAKIGTELRALRGGRTQREVAEAVHVTAQAIHKYEIGAMVPADDIKVALANYFDKTVEDIFFT